MSSHFEMLVQQAFRFHQSGETAQAESLCRFLLAQSPSHYQIMHLLGLLLYGSGRTLEAIQAVDGALAIKPDFAHALNNRGVMAENLGRHEEALGFYERALKSNPNYADALNNKGVVLKAQDRLEEAWHAYDSALAIEPDLADAHNNKGVIFQEMHRFDEALVCYSRAIELAPAFADAHWNEARCRLLLGDFARGWEKYEWRWKRERASTKRILQQPLWLGDSSLEGKTILLHAEQGLGDTIQFARYIPMVAALGANVIFEVQARLTTLVSGLSSHALVVPRGDSLPPFDVHCPLLSLPLAFNTELGSIPHQPLTISLDKQRVDYWRERLGEKKCLRVGLAWSGSTSQQDNHRRSVPVHLFSSLASVGVELISLQKELTSQEREDLRANGIAHFDEAHQTFSETAALIENMDLVISVCTSVAHLAGSMGKPLWILLHHAHDWRWLLGREDSPWYPRARLFRQTHFADWLTVMKDVEAALTEVVRT